MRRLMALIILIAGTVSLWAGGQAEGAASATRGKYLAGKGIIIPPAEIHADSYISQIDFNYPEPSTDLGVTLYSGHRQVFAKGQQEILQIGIQGRKLQFQDLPPMNLAFVIDKSGSMQSQDKMGWVKEAFHIFIQRVRDMDFVSLVVFDSGARVVYPSTRMNSTQDRLVLRQEVENLTPGGGTNLVAGLELGYQQVLSNFRKEYTNRVLFLTDGVGESKGILDMADTYQQMGINVSAIGVGENFDANLMVELARKGGGSSRFISDRAEMEKTFGTELDRMLVPVAKNLEMRLEFLPDVEILGTWGYDNAVEGKTLRYFLPTLHHRDYETILVDFRILPQELSGEQELARFSLVYTDVEGSKQEAGPFSLNVLFVEEEHPVTGFSDAMVLQAGTMLHFAQALQTIGGLYHSCQEDLNKVNAMREALFRAETEKAQKAQEAGMKKTIVYENLTSPEIQALETAVFSKMKHAIELTSSTKKELVNTRM
ncbi:MAG TPA: VWA domain-containing protein, partial [Spirochaetia bacterium]|nr:VWA domain-containing protein [Spirochaetia bacterium]